MTTPFFLTSLAIIAATVGIPLYLFAVACGL